MQKTLQSIATAISECKACKLSCTRRNTVPGEGSKTAEIVFLGEGPGETEDESGRPFVGRSGLLLTKMIESLGLTRNDVFIVNVVKCRPPNNRPPSPEEIAACKPFLIEQLNTIKPKVICALGKSAAVALGVIQPTDRLGDARSKTYQWNNIPVIPTYHPAYLLRSPADRSKAWADLQLLLSYVTRKSNEPSA